MNCLPQTVDDAVLATRDDITVTFSEIVEVQKDDEGVDEMLVEQLKPCVSDEEDLQAPVKAFAESAKEAEKKWSEAIEENATLKAKYEEMKVKYETMQVEMFSVQNMKRDLEATILVKQMAVDELSAENYILKKTNDLNAKKIEEVRSSLNYSATQQESTWLCGY